LTATENIGYHNQLCNAGVHKFFKNLEASSEF